MYAFNITGDLDAMLRRHDLVLAAGGTCVMAVLNTMGLAGLHDATPLHLPIHGHRAGWGICRAVPSSAGTYTPWQKLWRLAGVDHMHVNGLRNKFCESDDSVIAAARAVLAPVMPEARMRAMPVFSSGQTGLQAADTYAAIGRADLIHTAGGGIFGHPGGVAAGVEALREAWVAAIEGVPLNVMPSASVALHAALDSGNETRRPRANGIRSAAARLLRRRFHRLDRRHGSHDGGRRAHVLCLDTPTPDLLARFPDVRCVGLAGSSRGRSPEWMHDVLPAHSRGSRHWVRRSCNTRSARRSIRRRKWARSAGHRHRREADARAMVADGGRCAASEALSDVRQSVCRRRWRRLPARPPSDHVAPSGHADGRSGPARSFGRQTSRRVDLVDMLQLRAGEGASRVSGIERGDTPVVMIDVLDDETLVEAGRLVWEQRADGVFTASSSGLQYALAAYWRSRGWLPATPSLPSPGQSNRLRP